MTAEEKQKARTKVNASAVTAARKAAERAKTASGWKKWLLIAAAALAALVAGLTQVGCTYNATTATTADGATQSTTAFECKPGEILPFFSELKAR